MHFFFFYYSVIGSLSVLVVSIVRWRHLNKQVSWVCYARSYKHSSLSLIFGSKCIYVHR